MHSPDTVLSYIFRFLVMVKSLKQARQMTATNHNADYIFHKTLRQQNSFAVMKEKQSIKKTAYVWLENI